jgi:hypothetical protein
MLSITPRSPILAARPLMKVMVPLRSLIWEYSSVTMISYTT